MQLAIAAFPEGGAGNFRSSILDGKLKSDVKPFDIKLKTGADYAPALEAGSASSSPAAGEIPHDCR